MGTILKRIGGKVVGERLACVEHGMNRLALVCRIDGSVHDSIAGHVETGRGATACHCERSGARLNQDHVNPVVLDADQNLSGDPVLARMPSRDLRECVGHRLTEEMPPIRPGATQHGRSPVLAVWLIRPLRERASGLTASGWRA